MKSQWFEYKDQAFTLRKSGYSIKRIEAFLGIPRSTLSGWFKNLEISEEHKSQLMKNKEEAWTRARLKAAESHRAQKALRMLEAERAAKSILEKLDINNPEILDLAFAMLYLGEGAKNNSSSIASSDPMILKFVIAVLVKNYNSKLNNLFCDLHLRAD